MIVVTGAAGKTGQAVVSALSRSGEHVRALVYRPELEAVALGSGAGEVLVGDMREPELLARAVQGARAIYHIAPNMSPDELLMGNVAIAAAKEARLSRFIYHSVLHPQVEAMPHHWQKMRVEEQLFQSGLAFTILQPAAYMQNILANWESIRTTGQYSAPYPATTRISLVDLRDVAQVAVEVLAKPGHEGAIYELCGTGPLSQNDVAETLSQVLGKPVEALEIPLNQWQARAHDAGLSHYATESLLQMFRYYAEYGFVGNPRVLGWVLGRAPHSLEAFVRSAA